MSLRKDEELRRQGMDYAYRYALKNGIEALGEEIKRRNISHVPLSISHADLEKFSDQAKHSIVRNVEILSIVTLRDEFGFGKDRIKRYTNRLEEKADCITGDYTTWDDQIQIILDEVGLDYRDGI